MSVKRQFIAGAACPACGAVDKIQRCVEGDVIWMQCVACDMVRNLDDQPPATDANEQTVTLRAPSGDHGAGSAKHGTITPQKTGGDNG